MICRDKSEESSGIIAMLRKENVKKNEEDEYKYILPSKTSTMRMN